jgi:uncharacterized protein (TIGR02722 family)
MKAIKTTLALASIAPLLFAGCASSQKATYVDPNGPRTVATVGQINIQDWDNASNTMINSLIDNVISTGRVKGTTEAPAIMAISRIVNSTGQHIDTDLLVKKIRIALNRTGRVLTTTTVGLGGQAEDPLAKELKQVSRAPDYTLSGKIIEDRVRQDSTLQSSYVFQLSLTDNSGVAVWEEEKTITKQGKRVGTSF